MPYIPTTPGTGSRAVMGSMGSLQRSDGFESTCGFQDVAGTLGQLCSLKVTSAGCSRTRGAVLST